MRTYRLNGTGLDALSCSDETLAAPAPGEVRLTVNAAAINYRDIGILHGHYPAGKNIIPFSDAAGTVTALGDGVERLTVGDEVISTFYEDWPSGAATAWNHRRSFGAERDGFLAQAVNAPASGLVHKPKTLSAVEAATLPCAALTAWSALFTEGGLQAGQHVVIEGTGGVALFALQFAKMAGASVTILSSSDAKLERAAAMGADHRVNYNTVPDWASAVQGYTNGRGADVVVELGGAQTLSQALKAIRVDGIISVIGVLSGRDATISISDILQRHARIHGITVGHREDMLAMSAAIDLHKIKPVIDGTYGFDDVKGAYAALPEGKHFGKLVVDFG